MPNFTITAPDGTKYNVTGPEGATEQDALQQVQQQHLPPVESRNVGQFFEHSPYGFGSELAHSFTMGLSRPTHAAAEASIAGIKQLLGKSSEGIGEAYSRGEKEYDAARQGYQAASPITSTVADVTGGIGTLGKGLLNAPNFIGRLLQGAKLGGIYGGVSGGAEASGGLPERAMGAGTGALMGAGVGAAIPAAIDTARLATAPVRSMLSAMRNPEGVATRQIAQKLHEAGISPPQAQTALDQARASGVTDMTLADVGGRNLAQRTATYAKVPGPGKEAATDFLQQRAATRGENIMDVARPSLGHPELTQDTIDTLTAGQKAASAPAYKAAYEAGDKAVWSPELERLTASPTVQRAMRSAVNLWQDRAIADGFGAMNPGALGEHGGQLKLLNGKVPALPNLQFWDYTKRMIDDQIGPALRAGQNTKVDTLTNLVKQLRGALDKEVPEYTAARAAYGGPAQSLNAIEQGRKFLTMPHEEVGKVMQGLAPGDQQMARLGAARSLQELVGGTSDRTRQLLSPNMQRRMANVFPDEDSLSNAVRGWTMIKQQNDLARRALGGSSTFENLADAGEAKIDPGVLTKLATGHFLGAGADALRGTLNRFSGVTPKVAQAGLKTLLATDQAQQRSALQAISAEQLRQQLLSPAALNRFGRGFTGAGVGLLGNLPAKQRRQIADDARAAILPGQ